MVVGWLFSSFFFLSLRFESLSFRGSVAREKPLRQARARVHDNKAQGPDTGDEDDEGDEEYAFEAEAGIPAHLLDEDKPYQCRICRSSFKFKRSLTRHIKSTHEGGFGTCRVCTDVKFSQKVSYEKHLQKSQKHVRCGSAKIVNKTLGGSVHINHRAIASWYICIKRVRYFTETFLKNWALLVITNAFVDEAAMGCSLTKPRWDVCGVCQNALRTLLNYVGVRVARTVQS